MITLLSPSKKLNLDSQDIIDHYTQCEFIKSAETLANKAKNLTENDLKELIYKVFISSKERFNAS